MEALKITYENGATQIVNPSKTFDGNYHALAHDIAKGAKHSYVILNKNKKNS